MSGAIIGPVAAALIGLLLSYIEAYNKRSAAPRREVAWWVVFRISVDSSISAAAFPAALLVFPQGQWWLAAVTSGVGAPAFLRSQVSFTGKNGNLKNFGPDVPFGKLRDWIDGKIDRHTSSADSAWVINEAAPQISRIPANKLLSRIEGYYKLLERASGFKATTELNYFKRLFNSTTTSDVNIYEAVVFQLLSYGHRELVEGLITEGAAYTPTEEGGTSDDRQPRSANPNENGYASQSVSDDALPTASPTSANDADNPTAPPA